VLPKEQSPSLLAIILDTNPAAWALLADALPLSTVVANLLVFINAHLACNYTNKVAVIASHPDKAQWLYPTAVQQKTDVSDTPSKRNPENGEEPTQPSKRLKLNGPESATNDKSTNDKSSHGSKYPPFRLIEEALLSNLSALIQSTTPDALSSSGGTSTMIAGALTLALSYINRESTTYAESIVGKATDPMGTQTADTSNPARLQSRILLISASPTTDLAHQYIPIMNAIFACQRLSIPIDIPTSEPTTPTTSNNSTVFLQQASDATRGIYLPFVFPPSSTSPSTIQQIASSALLTYLLSSLLPSPLTRTHLTSPTQINIDFRAACFCHRRVIDLGFVCSICLSIFCEVPEGGECLTCGTKLELGEGVGREPRVVVGKRRKKKGKGRREGAADGVESGRVTPVGA
jgi:transcription initiation factor TFIIH subunit 3